MRFSRSAFVRSVAAAVALCASTRAAHADPLGDLKNASIATMNARTYHFTMTTSRGIAQGDMQLPSTMHMQMPGGMEMVILPTASFMKMKGTWRKLPGFAGNDFASNSTINTMLAKLGSGQYRVTDLGMRPFNGASMHAYQVSDTKSNRPPSIDYVDASGRIGGITLPKMTMTFSNFGAPVNIAAPM